MIIEESLRDKSLLKNNDIRILKTTIQNATEWHQTPWLKQWTVHDVEIPDGIDPDLLAQKISQAIDKEHKTAWYADYKDNKTHYVIFRGRIFKLDRSSKKDYDELKDYALSIGLPKYMVPTMHGEGV